MYKGRPSLISDIMCSFLILVVILFYKLTIKPQPHQCCSRMLINTAPNTLTLQAKLLYNLYNVLKNTFNTGGDAM